ncbi:MAG: nitrilase-related carbon-nitrogen hydrolase [Sphingopyxis sp.]|nr:nitrilase-related carbon-nitrogen hydrolase [Sphingopyxis sp.]
MELNRRHALAAALASGAILPEGLAAMETRELSVSAPAPFAAVAMQLTARSVERLRTRAEVTAQIKEQVAAITPQIRAATIFIQQYGGAPVKLAVLPEYLFTSYPGRIGISEFAELAAFDIDGPEYAAIAAMAMELKLFIAGNAYERDKNFPGIYFQASFVIAPDGQTVLRYRRLNSMFAPTPHDVWSKYLDIYGLDGVFPVARTEIGNLAAIASEEILYPEIARAHALRGAEIFVHSSSEIGSPLATPKAIAKRARAMENLAYVVSANTAGIGGTVMPLASADGNSLVVDWKGNVLSEANNGETFTAFADIDLHALRSARRKPGMTNFLSRQRTGLFAAAYAGETHQRADGLMKDGAVTVPDRDYFKRTSESVIERLAKDGLI